MSKITEATQWTLLTMVGLAGGIVTGLVVGKPIGKIVGAMLVTAIVTSLVGAILGGFQAIWLRRRLAQPVWWIAATTGGVGIGLALGAVAVEQTGILITGQRPNIVHLSTSVRALSFLTVGLIGFVVMSGLLFGAMTSWPLLKKRAAV